MGNVIYPHRIRLRGPWQCEPLERQLAGSEVLPMRMVRMPCRWRDAGLADFAGRVRFSRKFGYPGQIDSWERVWLTFAGIEGRAEIALNEQSLGSANNACEFEATQLLAARNRLDVVIEASSPDAGLWGEVASEVRCTAYLQNVRAWIEDGRLRVRGDVAGVADQPLEIYVLNDRHTLAYQEVKAGATFETAADDDGGSRAVRVELVNVSTVWHALSVPIAMSQRD